MKVGTQVLVAAGVALGVALVVRSRNYERFKLVDAHERLEGVGGRYAAHIVTPDGDDVWDLL